MTNDWVEKEIDDVAEVIGGGTPSTKDESNFGGDIAWITPKDLSGYSSRYISRGERNITEKGLRNSSARLLPKGSVLLTTRAPVGYLAISANPVTTNQGFHSLVPKTGYDAEFIYYLLKANVEILKSHSTGTTFGELTGSVLRRLRFCFPAYKEQRAIAHILGTLDDKIELNRQMNATLEAIARALFKSWFVDFDPVRAKAEGRQPAGMDAETAALFPDAFVDSELGKIPRGWRVAPLPEVFEVNPSRSLKNGDIAPYLDMANMPTQGHRAIDWLSRPFGSGTRFINGDTLVARITPCLENGKTAFVDFLADGQVGWGSTEYIVLRPKPPLPLEYAYLLARGEDLRAHLIQNMTGTSGRQRAPASCLDQYLMVVPSQEVARRFDGFIRPVFATIRANDEQSRTLAALRDALLPKLISGEIRIKDAVRLIPRI